MFLRADTVREIVADCLFTDDARGKSAIIVQGITMDYGLDPAKVKKHKPAIIAMLKELPEDFHEKAGGASFLAACYDCYGSQWGEHPDMQSLFLLGMAIGRVKCLAERKYWNVLPGGVPYYRVTSEEFKVIETQLPG